MATERLDTGKGVHLLGMTGAYKGNEYYVRRDEFIIGRSPECDLVINETTVSGKHSKITKVGEQFEIADLGSTNGTFVNGVKVDVKRLRTDDNIKFDVYEFRYINPAEVKRTVMSQAPDFAEAKRTEVRGAPVIHEAPQPQPPHVQPQPMAPYAQAGRPAPHAHPRVQTARFERGGSLILGLIVGLIIAYLFGFGGMVLGNLVTMNFNMNFFQQSLQAVSAAFPLMHTHSPWMNAVWTQIGTIIIVVCIPLGLLLGGVVTQSIGRKNRFATAIVFSFFYVLIALVVQLAATGFNFDTWRYWGTGVNLGITDPWLALAAATGYFFGVTFVLSFIGALLGRK